MSSEKSADDLQKRIDALSKDVFASLRAQGVNSRDPQAAAAALSSEYQDKIVTIILDYLREKNMFEMIISGFKADRDTKSQTLNRAISISLSVRREDGGLRLLPLTAVLDDNHRKLLSDTMLKEYEAAHPVEESKKREL